MVIGGGPAGMWAAKIAAMRGHDVTLYEKESILGGQVAIAMKGAGREEFGAIIRNERNQLNALGVPVVLGRTITPEFVLAQSSRRSDRRNGLPGRRSPLSPEGTGRGSSRSGRCSKERLTWESACSSSTTTGATRPRARSNTSRSRQIRSRCHDGLLHRRGPGADPGHHPIETAADKKGVTFTPDFYVTEIRGTEVHGINVYSNEPKVFSDFDTVVAAMGSEASDALYFALKGKVKELYRAGDCVAPRKVDMAIHEGYTVGRSI